MLIKFVMIKRFGEKRLYAENENADIVLNLIGKNCMRMEKIKYLQELGHQVEVYPEPEQQVYKVNLDEIMSA